MNLISDKKQQAIFDTIVAKLAMGVQEYDDEHIIPHVVEFVDIGGDLNATRLEKSLLQHFNEHDRSTLILKLQEMGFLQASPAPAPVPVEMPPLPSPYPEAPAFVPSVPVSPPFDLALLVHNGNVGEVEHLLQRADALDLVNLRVFETAVQSDNIAIKKMFIGLMGFFDQEKLTFFRAIAKHYKKQDYVNAIDQVLDPKVGQSSTTTATTQTSFSSTRYKAPVLLPADSQTQATVSPADQQHKAEQALFDSSGNVRAPSAPTAAPYLLPKVPTEAPVSSNDAKKKSSQGASSGGGSAQLEKPKRQ